MYEQAWIPENAVHTFSCKTMGTLSDNEKRELFTQKTFLSKSQRCRLKNVRSHRTVEI